MATLSEMLRQTMERYAGPALNGWRYLTSSADQQLLTVTSVGQVRDLHIVDTGLVARVEGHRSIIMRDINDKPLVDALLQAAVPREQIVLAYAGESAAATASLATWHRWAMLRTLVAEAV